MKGSRQSRALVLLALAAVAMVSVARLQSGRTTGSYAHSVLAYLAAAQNEAAAAAPRGMLPAGVRSSGARPWTAGGPTPLLDLFPICFVGLIAPLALALAASTLASERPVPTPALPFRFQRPPPTQLL